MQKLLLTFFLAIPFLIAAQQKTHVPDDNFEAFLESYGYGDGIENNDSVWTSAIDTLTVLSVGAFGTYKGIEDFTNLKEMYCYGTTQLGEPYYIGNLDLSYNTLLTKLYIIDCTIDTFNITQNPALKHLTYTGVTAPPLDVSGNINLEYLNCKQSSLNALDISNNVDLDTLICHGNSLTSLDLTQNINLKQLICNGYYFTSLNLSKNINLEHFECSCFIPSISLKNSPYLKIFDIRLPATTNPSHITPERVDIQNGNNQNITLFNVKNCPNLVCVNVDDSSYSSTASNWQIDDVNLYTENCIVSGIEEEIPITTIKTLIKIVDILGRETAPKPNIILFYIYTDRTVEKRLMID